MQLVEKSILHLFNEYPNLAIVISICISILIAVIGVLPSVFITAANILFFGFWNGAIISFFGESIGAGIAFLLYRKGFKKAVENKFEKYPKVKSLITARGKEAFYGVFSLRLIPFVPSGLVSFAAAIGSMSFSLFFIASSIGKIPALLLESYAVYEVTNFGWQGKLILTLVAVGILVVILKNKKRV